MLYTSVVCHIQFMRRKKMREEEEKKKKKQLQQEGEVVDDERMKEKEKQQQQDHHHQLMKKKKQEEEKKKQQEKEEKKKKKQQQQQDHHQLKKSSSRLLCCFSFLGSFLQRTKKTSDLVSKKSSSSSSKSSPLKEEKESIAAAAAAAAATDKTTCSSSPPPPCKQQQQQQVPWLMLSKVDRHEKSRSFFSLDEKQVHEIKFSKAANRSWCSGSSNGWLVMSHKTRGNFLYNPMTQTRINFPPHEIISYYNEQQEDERLRNLCKHHRVYFMDKAIIVSLVPTITTSSSSSSSSSFNDHSDIVVAVIYARSCRHGFSGVGFCRPGDKEWCNVPFHDVQGGEDNMVAIEGNPEVASVEGEGGEDNMVAIEGNPEVASVEGEGGEDNNGEEEEDYVHDDDEDEDEEEEEEDEVHEVHEEEEEEEEDNNSEEEEEEEEEDESSDDDNELAYLQNYASDIIFYKGAFYVVTGRTTKLGIIDISSSSSSSGNNKLKGTVRWPDIQPLKLKKSEKHILNNYYLVESCGELLMVIRIRRERTSRKALGVMKTKKFLVFKLDETGDTLKWVRTESLGDQILFLGCNHSKSVSVSDMSGYRGNSIYFTDDTRFLFMSCYSAPVCFRDIGVFFLEDEKIEPIFPKDDNPSTYYRKYCSNRKHTPTFITPNPYPSSYTGAVTRDNKN